MMMHYIIRNTFSLEKLTYNEETNTVIYQSKPVLNSYSVMTHGKNKKNSQIFHFSSTFLLKEMISGHNFQKTLDFYYNFTTLSKSLKREYLSYNTTLAVF